MDNKKYYEVPDTQALELCHEGVICGSLDAPGFDDGGDLPFLGE